MQRHTRTAVAFACWNLLLFLGLKNNNKFQWENATAYVYVANEFIQKISPGGHAFGHGINRRNTRVIKMQNVTLLD